MKISTVSYDAIAGVITLTGAASAAEAVQFLSALGADPLPPRAGGEKVAEKKIAGRRGGKKVSETEAPPDEDEEDDDEDDEDEEGDDEDEDEDEEGDEEGDDEEAPPKKAAGKGGKIKLKVTPEMKACTRLREVVAALVKQGVGKDDMLAACKALKDKVPVLGRVANLDDRVPQAYEVVKSLGKSK